MANIATGFVRLFPKENHLLQVGDILSLLCNWHGDSYHVPIFVRQNEFSLVTDIQFGDRWETAHGLDDVWNKHSEALKALWWRNFNDGGDHDNIGWIDDTGSSNGLPEHTPKWCRYGFDHMRITWKSDKLVDDFGLSWDKQDGTWNLEINGSYRAGNDRCNLLLRDQDIKPMPTLTTLTRGRRTDRLYWDNDEFTPRLSQLLLSCEEQADTIEFFWKQRLVRLQRSPQNTGSQRRYWQDFCLDDWDNCVDDDWLVFNELSFTPDTIA